MYVLTGRAGGLLYGINTIGPSKNNAFLKKISALTNGDFSVSGKLNDASAKIKIPNHSFEKFQKAAQKGDSDAMYFLGTCYRLITNIEGALLWKDIRGNRPKGQFALYLMDGGYEIESFIWFKKAADSGNADAMLELALCYKAGRGTKKNQTLSFEWLSKAAENKNNFALRYVARCYYTGTGVKENREKAILFYKRAATGGDGAAQEFLRKRKIPWK